MIPVLRSLPFRIRLQRALGWTFCLPFYAGLYFLARGVGGYQVAKLPALRRKSRKILSRPGPIVLCSNHRCTLDSIFLIWAMGSAPWYFLNYRRFSWNMPAGDFFASRLSFRLVAYLGKCVFVYRDRSARHKHEVASLAKTLVQRGELFTIFPEGRRTRSGKFEVERLTSGAAKIIAEVPGCRLVCAHIAGNYPYSLAPFPPRGAKFRIVLKEVKFAEGQRNPESIQRMMSETIQGMELGRR